MTQNLNGEWARSQIEAYVDGDLNADDGNRMQVAMAKDTELQTAVARATAVRRGLRSLRAPATPFALAWRLLRIPNSGAPLWSWLVAPAMAAVLLVVVFIRLLAPQLPVEDPRTVAVEEFALAMAYLQRTAEVTQREVNGAVVFGFNEALKVGRSTMREDGTENGG